MTNFGVIFKHYMIRMLRNKFNVLILMGIPLGIILLNAVAISNNLPEGMRFGELEAAVWITLLMTLSFQFFSCEMLLEFLNWDFRGDVRERLYVAPVPKTAFMLGVGTASLVMSILQGLAIFLIMIVGFGVNLGTPAIWLPVLILTAIMAQLLVVLIVLCTTSKKMGSGVSMAIGFGLMATSGGLFVPREVIPDVLFYNSPVNIGRIAVMEGGATAVTNLGILAGVVVVLTLLVGVISRRRTV